MEGELDDLLGQFVQSLAAVGPNNAQPQVDIKARKLKKHLPKKCRRGLFQRLSGFPTLAGGEFAERAQV